MFFTILGGRLSRFAIRRFHISVSEHENTITPNTQNDKRVFKTFAHFAGPGLIKLEKRPLGSEKLDSRYVCVSRLIYSTPSVNHCDTWNETPPIAAFQIAAGVKTCQWKQNLQPPTTARCMFTRGPTTLSAHSHQLGSGEQSKESKIELQFLRSKYGFGRNTCILRYVISSVGMSINRQVFFPY